MRNQQIRKGKSHSTREKLDALKTSICASFSLPSSIGDLDSGWNALAFQF